MSIRRNTVVRTVATVCGDIAVGTAIASTCIWVVEAAALGLFLSFLLWLLGALLALALSQYVVHATVNAVLSDRKLDLAIDALQDLAAAAHTRVADIGGGLRRYKHSAFDFVTARMHAA